VPHREPLHFREAGASDSRDVLLLVHGFPFSSAMWGPQLEAPPPGWRVIAADLPGFGGSAPLEAATLGMDDAGDRLALLLNTLGVTAAVVCGLSMGGYVTFELLRRYPALVRALVLCDTRAGPDSDEARRGRLETAATVRREGTAAGVVDSMLPKLLSPHSRRGQPGLDAELRTIMEAAPAGAVAAALEGMARRPDSTPMLRSIAVPTQIMVGEDDEITPLAEAQLLARGIPGALLTVVPDAGHVPNLENPAVFNRTLHAFLAALR
jgi:pimeloyl-ACP methyl ester carboxylesterase